jgi:hypothetical protein
LGQSLEYLFEEPYLTLEVIPSTSSKLEVHLDDFIKRIENLSLDENPTPSQSIEQLGVSQKGPPKWLTKIIENVHPDEVKKIGTKISSRQDGGNVDNSKSGNVDDVDVSYDCELNLSTNLELNSFEEENYHDELKEAIHNECDSLINNGT